MRVCRHSLPPGTEIACTRQFPTCVGGGDNVSLPGRRLGSRKERCMLNRILAVVAVLALALLISAPVVAADAANTHEGKITKVDGDKITMSDKEGKNEHTHTLAADAKVTVDGKAAKAADLKAGMSVKVTTKKDSKDTAVKVDA